MRCARAAALGVLAAIFLLDGMSGLVVSAAEGEWRAATQTAEAGPRHAESTRSVVVRRNGARVARTPSPNREFDPFDDAADLMPAVEPAGEAALAPFGQPVHDPFDDVAAAPAPRNEFDPFEQDAAAAPATEAPAAPAEEPAFEEPAVEEPLADEPSFEELTPPRAPLAGSATLGDELVESELAGEVAAPSPKADMVVSEPADVVEPTLEDELAAPGLGGGFELSPEALDDLTNLQPGAAPQPTPEQLEERRRQLELQRQKADARCRDLVEAVRADSIRSINLDISVTGNPGEDFPFECRAEGRSFTPRNWSQVTYMWKASALCHKPLYFEQVQVERYGHSWGPALQPIMSGAHFFATIPILPYKMGLETPNECIYTLGHYRPGDCAPYMIPAFPFTWRAAAFQAGAVTGAAAVVP